MLFRSLVLLQRHSDTEPADEVGQVPSLIFFCLFLSAAMIPPLFLLLQIKPIPRQGRETESDQSLGQPERTTTQPDARRRTGVGGKPSSAQIAAEVAKPWKPRSSPRAGNCVVRLRLAFYNTRRLGMDGADGNGIV